MCGGADRVPVPGAGSRSRAPVRVASRDFVRTIDQTEAIKKNGARNHEKKHAHGPRRTAPVYTRTGEAAPTARQGEVSGRLALPTVHAWGDRRRRPAAVPEAAGRVSAHDPVGRRAREPGRHGAQTPRNGVIHAIIRSLAPGGRGPAGPILRPGPQRRLPPRVHWRSRGAGGGTTSRTRRGPRARGPNHEGTHMRLQFTDWAFVFAYFAVTLAIGLWAARRAGRSTSEFFLSGRSMPWWLLGTSMVATTFSTDTPN